MTGHHQTGDEDERGTSIHQTLVGNPQLKYYGQSLEGQEVPWSVDSLAPSQLVCITEVGNRNQRGNSGMTFLKSATSTRK